MSKISSCLINKHSTALPPRAHQKVTPLEPGLASQITSAHGVKVKGTVSPFKRHMSVSVLGMINNV